MIELEGDHAKLLLDFKSGSTCDPVLLDLKMVWAVSERTRDNKKARAVFVLTRKGELKKSELLGHKVTKSDWVRAGWSRPVRLRLVPIKPGNRDDGTDA